MWFPPLGQQAGDTIVFNPATQMWEAEEGGPANATAETSDNTPLDTVVLVPEDDGVYYARVITTAKGPTGDNTFVNYDHYAVTRVAGTTSVTQLAGQTGIGTGTGGTVTSVLAASGDDVVVRLTGNVGEDWSWEYSVEIIGG